MFTYNYLCRINKEICQKYNHMYGIKEDTLLKSIPEQVNQYVFGMDLYPTIQDKIAYIFTSLIKNHCFLDGNKRTAIICYIIACMSNKIELKSKKDLYDIALEIATSKYNLEHTKQILF